MYSWNLHELVSYVILSEASRPFAQTEDVLGCLEHLSYLSVLGEVCFRHSCLDTLR